MEKIEAYFSRESPFKEGIQKLREIILSTELNENLKWGAPVYTLEGKNVLGIMAFKNHFGIWFFQGVFLSDPKKVLENAQEGKTKAMRHWKLRSNDEINERDIMHYVQEAISNQKKGLVVKPSKKAYTANAPELNIYLDEHPAINQAFKELSKSKQNEYHEYIVEAKQAKTKQARLLKIAPLISAGQGLNDLYKSR